MDHVGGYLDIGGLPHRDYWALDRPLDWRVVMGIPRDLLREHPGLNEWSILTGYRGSIAHGTYVPNHDPHSVDDKDVMAICVPPLDYYYGLKQFGSRGTQEIKRDEWDIVVYEAKKFISLLAQGNPNVLMMLWLEPKYYIDICEAGQLILDARKYFVGRHVYKAFTGYAYSQLHKMTHGAWDGYMGQKRKALVARYGYDTKNASHLIRLLRMGVEFLRDGQLYVEREDAKQLLEIKRGEWPLKKVQAEADRYFKLTEEAYLHSTLPEGPDFEAINRLCVAVVQSGIKRYG